MISGCQRMRGREQRIFAAAAAAKLLQSCPTLCDTIDGSPPGSPIPGMNTGKNTGVGCHPPPVHESEK